MAKSTEQAGHSPDLGAAIRATRIGMIVLGLLIWVVSIALPGWSMPGLLLGASMVSWACFGLMVDKPNQDTDARRSWNESGTER